MGDDTRYWLDILERKHECGPSLMPYVLLERTVEGRSVRALIPDRFERLDLLELKAVIGSGPLLSLIARYPADEDYPEERVFLMVARAPGDGPHVVHVWHELFPWALNHLGLSDDGGRNP